MTFRLSWCLCAFLRRRHSSTCAGCFLLCFHFTPQLPNGGQQEQQVAKQIRQRAREPLTFRNNNSYRQRQKGKRKEEKRRRQERIKEHSPFRVCYLICHLFFSFLFFSFLFLYCLFPQLLSLNMSSSRALCWIFFCFVLPEWRAATTWSEEDATERGSKPFICRETTATNRNREEQKGKTAEKAEKNKRREEQKGKEEKSKRKREKGKEYARASEQTAHLQRQQQLQTETALKKRREQYRKKHTK